MKASKSIIRDFGEVEKLQVSKKGPADFVTNADLKAAGVKNGSFVFGFYAGSDYKPDAYAAINAAPNNATKTANLTLFRRSKDGVLPSNMLFNPITHVGIYYNDQFNHMLSVPYQHPTPNFYPIAHYEFLPRLKELSRE